MRVLPLLLCLLSACTVSPIERMVMGATDTLHVPTATQGILAALLPITIVGVVREVPSPTACRSQHGVNPRALLPREVPRVGREVVIAWVTRACVVPPPPAEACWLIASTADPRPVDFSPYGAPGCWLMSPLDQIVAVPTTPGGLVVRDGGVVMFRWTPPAWAAGTRMLLQLLVRAPDENSSGWLVAQAVELIVGTA